MLADDGVPLHVGVTGRGPDVVLLSGGPGCVQYLEQDALAPARTRAWFPEPRGAGRSGGGAHPMARAVADLEAVRRAARALVPRGRFAVVPDVPHDLWSTDPTVWRDVVTSACALSAF